MGRTWLHARFLAPSRQDTCTHMYGYICTTSISRWYGRSSLVWFSLRQIGHTLGVRVSVQPQQAGLRMTFHWALTWRSVGQTTGWPTRDARFNTFCVGCVRVTLWKETCVPDTFLLVNDWCGNMYLQCADRVPGVLVGDSQSWYTVR